jgi:5'-3' exonuclease
MKPEKVAQIRQGTAAANPGEKNILRRVLQLLRLNIRLIFVFDGNDKPNKRGKYMRGQRAPVLLI